MPNSQNIKLARSSYRREDVVLGVVHVGISAFHRSHQAAYYDSLMEKTGDLRWGVAGVNVRAAQSPETERLRKRNGEYVLKTVSFEGKTEYRLVRSLIRVIDHATASTEAHRLLALPSVHVVSATVTESGYYMASDGSLDVARKEIADELAGGPQSTIYGFLRAGLRARMEADGAAVTIMCCDNLRENGKILRRNFLAYLSAAKDDALLEWVKTKASFPCAMVDRITPRPTDALSHEIEELFGIKDDFSVFSEDFSQWVIEDAFAAERPPLDAAGAEFVPNVAPYEEAKIRLLNGGHSCVAYLAALKGYSNFGTALRDPELSAFFDAYEREDAVPGLKESPLDLASYVASIKNRFLNPHIADAVERICMDGANKIAIFVRPTMVARYEAGAVPRCAIAVAAAWYAFMRRVAEGNAAIPYVDPSFDELKPLLALGKEAEFAGRASIWGDLPVRFPRFVVDVTEAIRATHP
ncbi:MAG: mannitol dehydrogenase family protein [Rickettsiales bacterium]